MLTLLLALAATQFPGVGVGYQSTGGVGSPVVGVVDFTTGFGSSTWGPSAPSPTIDCVAAASGGNLTCSGMADKSAAATMGVSGFDFVLVGDCATAFPGDTPTSFVLTYGAGSTKPVTTNYTYDSGGCHVRVNEVISPGLPGTFTASWRAPISVTKSGSPTTVGSPWWSRGWGGGQDMAVRYAGSEYHDLGTSFVPSNDFTVCLQFKLSTTSGTQFLLAKYGNGGFYIGNNSGILMRECTANNGACSNSNALTASTGSSVLCISYKYGAVANTSEIRANLNGTASTPITNAAGPVGNDASLALRIGAGSDGSYKLSGDVSRVTIFNGFAADASQLNSMVASQIGLLASKPAGTVLSHSRSDATLCGPYPDNMYYWLAPNVPCILPTSGIEVYGRAYNYAQNSEAFNSWTLRGNGGNAAPVVTPNTTDVADPMGGYTAEKVVFPAFNGSGDTLLRGSGNQTGGAMTESVWARTLTGTARFWMETSCTGGLPQQQITVTSTWTRHVLTGTAPGACGIDLGYNAMAGNPADPGGGGTVYLWGAQLSQTAYPMPYRSTGGTSYDGGGGSATTVTVPTSLTDPAKWAVSWTGSATPWGGAGQRSIFAMGAGGTANATDASCETSGTCYFNTFDSSSAQKYVTMTAPAAGQRTLLLENSSSALRWYVDGALASGSASGAGSGTLSAFNSTLQIGGKSGGYPFGGSISRVVQCRKAAGCK